MIDVKVSIKPSEIGKKLREEVKKLPAIVADYIEHEVRSNWLDGVDPDKVPWAPLARSTIEARRKRNIAGVSPLIATGDMLNSLTVVRGEDSASITIDSPALYHQKGTKRMTQRELVPEAEGRKLPDRWEKDITELMNNRLKLLFPS